MEFLQFIFHRTLAQYYPSLNFYRTFAQYQSAHSFWACNFLTLTLSSFVPNKNMFINYCVSRTGWTETWIIYSTVRKWTKWEKYSNGDYFNTLNTKTYFQKLGFFDFLNVWKFTKKIACRWRITTSAKHFVKNSNKEINLDKSRKERRKKESCKIL